MATKTEIAAVLGMMAAANPRFSLTEDTVAVYQQLLKDLPADLLQAAAVQTTCEVGFFPSVHEIRRTAHDLLRQAAGIPNAFEAWADLLQAGDGKRAEIEERDGAYHIVNRDYAWLHGIIPHVAAGLGWPRTFPTENQAADRAHFVRAYEEALHRRMNQGLMLPEVCRFIEKNRLVEAGGQNEHTNR